MDLFSTFIDLARGPLPADRIIDGKSIKDILYYPESKSPHEIMFFHCEHLVMAVRYKQFKIHYRTVPIMSRRENLKNCKAGIPRRDFFMQYDCKRSTVLKEPLIFNIESDPGEEYPLPSSSYTYLLKNVGQLMHIHLQSIKKPKHPLLNVEYCSSKLIPCCNPPYCMCNYIPYRHDKN